MQSEMAVRLDVKRRQTEPAIRDLRQTDYFALEARSISEPAPDSRMASIETRRTARMVNIRSVYYARVCGTFTFMPNEHIIALLVAERDKLNQAIEALQGPSKRRGRPPKNPLAGAVAELSAPAKKRRRGMTSAARKAQSQRMKAYWAAKRKKPVK